jgi:four helix bundle protein
MTIQRFEDLEIWKEAREVSILVFKLTETDRFSKDFRFRDQIRASSGSVMDNIAEGFERDGNKEFKQFLSIAKGSCGETRSQLYRALGFGYLNQSEFDLMIEQTLRLSSKLSNFMNYLAKSEITGRKFIK